MSRYYLNGFVALSFALLVGCQTLTDSNRMVFGQSDNTTTTAVYSALVNNDLATLNIHVKTEKGVVTLSGYVKTIRQSDTAWDIASKVPGVKTVQNELIVRK